jgi:hypothetical protein
MTNILTAAEAANVLRCATTDALMLQLLPQTDKYILEATGRDWSADSPIVPTAKLAAQMLIVRWYEDPGGMAAGNALGWGLSACLTQLEALALELETSGVPDENLELESTNIAGEMAVSANFTLIFNHAMGASATGDVSMETISGDSVSVANTLDVTAKILTVNPAGTLEADSEYHLVIENAADVYGQTLSTTISIRTA